MIKKYLIFTLCLCMSFTLAAQTETYRLTDFFGGDGTVRLEGKSASLDISIPLSSVTDINSAQLRLEVMSSQALIKKRSQLYVRFNNATIGQVAFDPDRPSLVSEIEIPNTLWRAGFNTLTLAVSQHYAEQCVDGSAPELWSEINAYTSTTRAQTETYRLTDFFGGDGTVRLEGKSASLDISIPLSSVTDINSAQLRLEVMSSQALIKKRSQLYVRFNNATIGQVAFDPDRPSLVSEIEIPNTLWRAGFNTLTLAVSQHYAEQCVDGSAPELWSEINAYTSTLKIDASTAETRFMLDELSGFFNPGIGGQRGVQLYTAREADSELKQQALPIVAQALALRNQYQPLIIESDTFDDGYVLPQLDETENSEWNEQNIARYERSAWYLTAKPKQPVHVLVGTVEALSPVLSDERS